MNDVVEMAILQRTPNLPRKLSRHPFPQSTMADDIVQHLTSIDVLENHIIVMLMDDHLSHAAYVGVIEKHGKASFTKSSNLLGGIFGSLPQYGVVVDPSAVD
jgi:hypothetical protein